MLFVKKNGKMCFLLQKMSFSQNMYKICWSLVPKICIKNVGFGLPGSVAVFFSQYLYEICGLWLQSVSTHKFYTNIHTNFIQIFRNGWKSTAPSPTTFHFGADIIGRIGDISLILYKDNTCWKWENVLYLLVFDKYAFPRILHRFTHFLYKYSYTFYTKFNRHIFYTNIPTNFI